MKIVTIETPFEVGKWYETSDGRKALLLGASGGEGSDCPLDWLVGDGTTTSKVDGSCAGELGEYSILADKPTDPPDDAVEYRIVKPKSDAEIVAEVVGGMIVADQSGSSFCTCDGASYLRTPHLAAIAAKLRQISSSVPGCCGLGR